MRPAPVAGRRGTAMMHRTKLELTPRLRLLADWIAPGNRVVDVGTDHAYLPVYLLLSGKVSAVIAGDLRRGPLERAKLTGKEYGVADHIDFRLCDGLSAVSSEEVDTVIIAGMGGETIVSILAGAPWTADGRHTLLLQPMTRAEDLRAFLAEYGYRINREQLVLDRGILYPVMSVTGGKMILSTGQIHGGAALARDPLEGRFLTEKILRLQGAVAGLNRSGASADGIKADRLRDIITALLEMKEEWRHANGSDD